MLLSQTKPFYFYGFLDGNSLASIQCMCVSMPGPLMEVPVALVAHLISKQTEHTHRRHRSLKKSVYDKQKRSFPKRRISMILTNGMPGKDKIEDRSFEDHTYKERCVFAEAEMVISFHVSLECSLNVLTKIFIVKCR